MLNLVEWACILGVVASVGAPLFYAVATLNGLQHKTMYPLFRFIQHNRRVSSTEAPLSSSHNAGSAWMPSRG
jgi:hypothetical protein